MKKFNRIALSIVVALSVIAPNHLVVKAESLPSESKVISIADYKAQGKVTKVAQGFEESQVLYKFPEDNPTSRIYARGRRSFKAYKGRGVMVVENHGATDAEVYVNGKKVKIDKALEKADGKATIDIGSFTVNGENALKVLNVKPEKSYINVKVLYPELVYGNPEDVGFSKEKLAKVDELINSEVKKGLPGAVLLVVKDGKIVKNTSYGYKKIYDGNNMVKNPQTMTEDTMFDIASNSKMFATNLAIQKLMAEGKIKAEDLVCKYIPGFTGDGREKIRLKDIMTHSAGFAASIKFHDPKEAPKGFYSVDRNTTLKLLEKAPLVYPTGSKSLYSDTDYMLLGYIIENVTGQREDEYVENNIYKALGLTHTMYNPLRKGIQAEECAATERNGNTRDGSRDFPGVRKYTLQGEVHDEKAFYSMDGVSGHAGLFSTTHDLAVLAQLMLNGGGYGGFRLCDEDVIAKVTAPSEVSNGFGLGWNRQCSNNDNIYEFGAYASEETYGHTGWTGTVTSIDPKNDMAVILLTNKKNTPCPKGVFEGDSYETGKYGSVISLVYEALMEK